MKLGQGYFQTLRDTPTNTQLIFSANRIMVENAWELSCKDSHHGNTFWMEIFSCDLFTGGAINVMLYKWKQIDFRSMKYLNVMMV